MTAHYVRDTDGLGLGRPDHEPKATETIGRDRRPDPGPDRVGHAYAAEGDVYFRVASFPDYGKLSNRPLEEMQQGEGDDAAPLKESPQDFALWKAQKEGEDTPWDAPWGRGRPGWHIECSAMAEEILGARLRRSTAAARTWSSRTTRTRSRRPRRRAASRWRGSGCTTGWSASRARRWRSRWGTSSCSTRRSSRRAATRWSCTSCRATTASRSRTREDALAEAAASVERVRDFARRLDPDAPAEGIEPYAERFFDALADDFNTPAARAALFDWISEANRRLDAGETLGAGALAEDAAGARARQPARAPRRPRPPRPSGFWPNARLRGKRATSAPPTPGATSWRRSAGPSATRRRGPSWSAPVDRLRAQSRPRGGARAAAGRCASGRAFPPRSSSGSAARPTTRAFVPRSSSTRTRTRRACSPTTTRSSSRWTRCRTRTTSARSAAWRRWPARRAW